MVLNPGRHLPLLWPLHGLLAGGRLYNPTGEKITSMVPGNTEVQGSHLWCPDTPVPSLQAPLLPHQELSST